MAWVPRIFPPRICSCLNQLNKMQVTVPARAPFCAGPAAARFSVHARAAGVL